MGNVVTRYSAKVHCIVQLKHVVDRKRLVEDIIQQLHEQKIEQDDKELVMIEITIKEGKIVKRKEPSYIEYLLGATDTIVDNKEFIVQITTSVERLQIAVEEALWPHN